MLYEGKVAVVTGGAHGFGRAVAGRLAEAGAEVVLADRDIAAGEEAAREIGAELIGVDVSDPDSSLNLVERAVNEYGGLDLAFLNAGIATGCGMVEDFDLQTYRRAMGVNLDGVVFGINAAVPALRDRGGGAVVVSASLAGIVPVPPDPIYAANKHAVVGLVRSVGPVLAEEGIYVNAICPGFADTRIIDPFREMIEQAEIPLIEVGQVVGVVEELFGAGQGGDCVMIQAGAEPEPFRFRNVPAAR
jgi:NAD(P)-dependent dehydrogenase (short-subunit alcohol dehydrogenase family)